MIKIIISSNKKFFVYGVTTKGEFMDKEYFFIKNLAIWSFIDVCYELRSYKRGVAQLGSAGALGAYLFTNKNDCNK